MRKFPSPPLLLLAFAVLAVGYFSTRDGIQCRNRPLQPGETCDFGTSTATYEELAARPMRQFSTYLVVAGGVAVIAVIRGLLRKPSRLFSPYRWPGRTPTATLVKLVVAAVAVLAVGSFLSNQPATCGGQELRPGDRCVNLDTGASASASDVANAPITQLWIYVVVAVTLAIVAIVKLVRRRPPTAEEVAAFEASAAAARQGVAGWPDLLTDLDREVEAERRKAGLIATR